MTAADVGRWWFSECVECFTQFRDSPETAGVCTRCGHENHYMDEGFDESQH